ncbi:hypothetical protein EI16_04570 [Hydrogenovibrio marinus]|uniref:Uncharacterized protein n=2 Tax=Hydrogenovibrio marinus TaxID=28885 RepID=A0A066ZZ02_HYDMR|nr:hypothetical protein EI16_04570 [Hydrogenovibrio marinus]
MMVFRFLVLALVLSLITWLVLRIQGKKFNFGIVLIGSILGLLGVMFAFYGISILVANSNNF